MENISIQTFKWGFTSACNNIHPGGPGYSASPGTCHSVSCNGDATADVDFKVFMLTKSRQHDKVGSGVLI